MSPGSNDEHPGSRPPWDDDTLRARAEESYGHAAEEPMPSTPEEVQSLLHELRVHQIELEMQNEQLRDAQLQIDASRAKYFDLYDMAPVGYVTLNDASVVVEANLTAAGLLGVDRGELVGAPMSRFVASEDADAYYLRMHAMTGEVGSQDFEMRLRRASGSFWGGVQVRVRPPDRDGDRRISLTFTDIDDLKRAQAAEYEIAARFRAVVECSHDVIYTAGANGVFTFVSPSIHTLLGYDPEEVIGRTLADFVHPDDVEACERALARVVQDPKEHAQFEYRVRHADSMWRWFESNLAAVVRNDGSVCEYVGNARDITGRKFETAEMQVLAMTDELTGIGNRRRFLRAAEVELERARRHDFALSLLIIDVDNLKLVNDTYDHLVGDKVLVLVGRMCRDACRGADASGRLGGDEFGILLPHSGEMEGFEVAERLRHAIEREPAPRELPLGFKVTVSIGVAAANPDDSDFTSLLRRADAALHRAKQQGRNVTSF